MVSEFRAEGSRGWDALPQDIREGFGMQQTFDTLHPKIHFAREVMSVSSALRDGNEQSRARARLLEDLAFGIGSTDPERSKYSFSKLATHLSDSIESNLGYITDTSIVGHPPFSPAGAPVKKMMLELLEGVNRGNIEAMRKYLAKIVPAGITSETGPQFSWLRNMRL